MSTVINLKKRKLVGKKEVIVVISAIILTTLGIKASDNFFNPRDVEETSGGRCPADMVFVSSDIGGFCIDKYEASAHSDCPNLDPENQRETKTNLNFPECTPVSVQDRVPWRNISQDQAALACAKAGKRLPTNKEWLQAALGTPDYGLDGDINDCHTRNNWPQQPGLTGTGINCKSSAGAYDMVGNLWEWVEGAVNDGIYEDKKLPKSGYVDSMDGGSMPGITNPNQPNDNYNQDYYWIKETGLRGIARGGYWDNGSDAGQYSVYIVPLPSSIEKGIGFRCAK
ncbi:SUMF1/EgtB/PvdO family nonheme iron enzyme [Patescibacteria group bacterium]